MQTASDELRREVVRHFELYPGAQMSAATVAAWCAELGNMPTAAVRAAFAKARTLSPQFAPSAEQVAQLARVEAARIIEAQAEQREERLLPPPDPNQQRRRDDFYAACDRAARSASDKPIEAGDKPVVRGLVVMLLRYHGIIERKGEDRFPDWVVSGCERRKHGYEAIVRGIRRAPQFCRRAPTIGMLEALIANESMRGWPADWVEPDGHAAGNHEPARPRAEPACAEDVDVEAVRCAAGQSLGSEQGPNLDAIRERLEHWRKMAIRATKDGDEHQLALARHCIDRLEQRLEAVAP